jgi:magnesium-protoporphyrin IX monomethyl ester (oxidative) cyclase
MYNISLVNLPFAAITMPSLALMQIKAATERAHNDVRVRIVHANHDIARQIGVDLYVRMSSDVDTNMAGLGDWFFGRAAFPEQPDNQREYFRRFFRDPNSFIGRHRAEIAEKRQAANSYIASIIERYQLDREDLVGFTSMFCQNTASFAAARELKSRNPQIVTVIGGANCESPMGEAIIRNIEFVDYVFSGPALKNFPQLVSRLKSAGSADIGDVAIPGVLQKRPTPSAGRLLVVNGADCQPTRGEEISIDECELLDYGEFLDAFESTFAGHSVRASLPFETSRGCWWGAKAHCTFCGLNGQSMSYRAMAPALALRQFAHLFTFASRCGRFQAVDNILPREYLTEVLPFVKPIPESSIFYEVKADLSAEELAILAKAGVTKIQPGIEALSTSTLKLMKKGTSAFQNVVFLKNCLDTGIKPDWNLLIGFPGEQPAVYEKYLADLPRLTHLPPPNGVFPVRFDRYSPYFVRSDEYGLRLRANDWYRYVYPFDAAQLAYFFVDANVGAPYIDAAATHINALRGRVQGWRDLWHVGFTPQLLLDTQSGAVLDSRSGRAKSVVLDEVERALLLHLMTPKRHADIDSHFGGDASRAMNRIRELDLLFEEGDRALALVTGSTQREMESAMSVASSAGSL